jgi:hypothetical protein
MMKRIATGLNHCNVAAVLFAIGGLVSPALTMAANHGESSIASAPPSPQADVYWALLTAIGVLFALVVALLICARMLSVHGCRPS